MFLYVITNLVNDKKYIGITNNPKKRWENHKCCNDPSMVIAKAIKKYGVENFKFEVLLSNIPLDQIDSLEQEYIKKYNTHVSNGQGYNVSWGGKYHFKRPSKFGHENSNAHLSKEEAQYIKDHRDIPAYILYDQFSEKITYNAFRNVYNDVTYKEIKPSVDPYPFNNEFSNQFTSGNKISYPEVVELRKLYAQLVPWEETYTKKYQQMYPDKWTFWNIYYGNRYRLVMPEVFTKENRARHSHLSKRGEKNGRAKLTLEQVQQMRKDFESGTKTRKEIQQQYPFVTTNTINDILRYHTWKDF